jgi:hypothetical protein
VALLALLPAGGAPADSNEIQGRLGWEAERYASACARLEERGYIVAGPGRSKTVGRDLTAVPPEFRPACGRAGSDVTVRQVAWSAAGQTLRVTPPSTRMSAPVV